MKLTGSVLLLPLQMGANFTILNFPPILWTIIFFFYIKLLWRNINWGWALNHYNKLSCEVNPCSRVYNQGDQCKKVSLLLLFYLNDTVKQYVEIPTDVSHVARVQIPIPLYVLRVTPISRSLHWKRRQKHKHGVAMRTYWLWSREDSNECSPELVYCSVTNVTTTTSPC